MLEPHLSAFNLFEGSLNDSTKRTLLEKVAFSTRPGPFRPDRAILIVLKQTVYEFKL